MFHSRRYLRWEHDQTHDDRKIYHLNYHDRKLAALQIFIWWLAIGILRGDFACRRSEACGNCDVTKTHFMTYFSKIVNEQQTCIYVTWDIIHSICSTIHLFHNPCRYNHLDRSRRSHWRDLHRSLHQGSRYMFRSRRYLRCKHNQK